MNPSVYMEVVGLKTNRSLRCRQRHRYHSYLLFCAGQGGAGGGSTAGGGAVRAQDVSTHACVIKLPWKLGDCTEIGEGEGIRNKHDRARDVRRLLLFDREPNVAGDSNHAADHGSETLAHRQHVDV